MLETTILLTVYWYALLGVWSLITLLFVTILLSVHQVNPLHIAAIHGDLDTVRQLIDKGTDVNVRDDDGVSQEFRECTTFAWFLHLPLYDIGNQE